MIQTLGISWFRAFRSQETLELIAMNKNAFVLAFIIAHRAKWRDGFDRHGLALGEAMLGDYREYGMSEQQYRTAKQHLQVHGFATFRTTNKGTIGKLIDKRLFSALDDWSNGQNNAPNTDSQHPSNGQTTTNLTTKQGNKVSIIRSKKETSGSNKGGTRNLAIEDPYIAEKLAGAGSKGQRLRKELVAMKHSALKFQKLFETKPAMAREKIVYYLAANNPGACMNVDLGKNFVEPRDKGTT